MSDFDPWLPESWANPCPKCGQAAGKQCRSLTSGRTTDTHKARRDAWEERK